MRCLDGLLTVIKCPAENLQSRRQKHLFKSKGLVILGNSPCKLSCNLVALSRDKLQVVNNEIFQLVTKAYSEKRHLRAPNRSQTYYQVASVHPLLVTTVLLLPIARSRT